MLQELTDKELWAGIKRNDSEALSQLFQRYYFFLVRSGLQHLPDAELVKDAANDVFYHLWRSRTSLSEVENVKAYLGTAFRNQGFTLLRRNLKDRDRLAQWAQAGEALQSSYEDLLVALQVKEAQRERLHRALERLTPRQKEYLRLKYFEGLSYEQIAARTGQALKTIYNTTYEAIKILRQEVTL